MHDVLQHMTSYYNRYYGDFHGEQSSEWLHDHIAEVFPPLHPQFLDMNLLNQDHLQLAFPHPHLSRILHPPLPPIFNYRTL